MAQAAHPGVGVSENTHVTGRRVIAIIVDSIILGIVNSVVFFLFDLVAGTSAPGLSLEGAPAGLFGLVALLIGFGYFSYFEGTHGQTIGKMLAGIKVVREGTDQAPGFGPAAIRTVLRLVDGLFAYLVGFIVVMISSKRHRLGDMAAGTSVVRK